MAASDSGDDTPLDDDELDDASLRSMRAVWVSMREEEPPAAGMAQLLAAARANAEAMQPRASWWERCAGTLRRAPVLAFATVLLMAGGAVLVSRTQHDQRAIATTDETPADPAMATPVAASGSAAQAGDPPPSKTTTASPEVAAPSVTASPELRGGTDVAVLREGPPRAVKKSRRAAPSSKPEVEPVERAEKPATESPTPSTGGALAKGPLDTADDAAMASQEAGAAPTKPAPPRPSAEPRSGADRGTVIVNDSEQRKQTEATVKTPSVQQLAQQAESAAARKDCPAVRVLVARIRKQDAAFYKQRLANNAAITRCL